MIFLGKVILVCVKSRKALKFSKFNSKLIEKSGLSFYETNGIQGYFKRVETQKEMLEVSQRMWK